MPCSSFPVTPRLYHPLLNQAHQLPTSLSVRELDCRRDLSGGCAALLQQQSKDLQLGKRRRGLLALLFDRPSCEAEIRRASRQDCDNRG